MTLAVDIEEFDPAQHWVVRTIDAAIAKADAAESEQKRKDAL